MTQVQQRQLGRSSSIRCYNILIRITLYIWMVKSSKIAVTAFQISTNSAQSSCNSIRFPTTQSQSFHHFRALDMSRLDDYNDDEEIIDDHDNFSSDSFDNKPYHIDYDDDDSTSPTIRHMYVKNSPIEEREDRLYIGQDSWENCVLIGVQQVSDLRNANAFTLEESMTEMRELIRTAGLNLAGEVTQRLQEVNPRTFIGSGKISQVQQLLLELNQQQKPCYTLVFDAELTPGQQKQLENVFNPHIVQNDFSVGNQRKNRKKSELNDSQMPIKVLDRTALILDIFAQHAKTREGKLQVDLAIHVYRKPRLTKMWTHLERQSGAGGVGLRGPGESQLEIDKRLIRDRIIVLKDKISAVQKQRSIHRRGRDNMGLPILALVGYTNAGKSTLLNYLTQAGVLAENMLFATLDPTTRKVKLPGLKTHPEVLLTDTVGFIQKLPTQLVAAFRATLEEVKEADVLLHVMDISHSSWEKQEQAVLNVLNEIGAGDKPLVRVLNKIDLLDQQQAEDVKYEAAMYSGHSVAVSSFTGDGMIEFVATVEDALKSLLVPIEALVPYKYGKEMNLIQEVGHVEMIEYQDHGTLVRARVPQAVANRIQPFLLSNKGMLYEEGHVAVENDVDAVSY